MVLKLFSIIIFPLRFGCAVRSAACRFYYVYGVRLCLPCLPTFLLSLARALSHDHHRRRFSRIVSQPVSVPQPARYTQNTLRRASFLCTYIFISKNSLLVVHMHSERGVERTSTSRNGSTASTNNNRAPSQQLSERCEVLNAPEEVRIESNAWNGERSTA